MKRNRLWLYLLMAAAGASSLYYGEFVLVEKQVKTISGLCIGFGSAIFCLGIGNFIGAFVITKTEYDDLARKKNIEVNDERNTRIREKVGAKINQVVVYALSVIVLAMGFMQVNIIAILMVVSVLLLELVLAITLSNYYSKRM